MTFKNNNNMEFTKEEIEQVRNDRMIRGLARMFGLDPDAVIDEALNEIKKEEEKLVQEKLTQEHKSFGESVDQLFKETSEFLEEMKENGVLKCIEKDGKKFYYSPNMEKQVLEELNETENCNFKECVEEVPEEEIKEEPVQTIKKEYECPDTKPQPFLMNAEQLEKFINNYRALIEAEKKVGYTYGIEFQDSGSGFSFPSKINEIIWDLVRTIFGDENAEDIADYIFGNSNFDNVKSLYDELV